MIVGVIVSVFEGRREIEEERVGFIGKIVGVVIGVVVFGGWMV
ncbi:flagellar biosynthetic protein FliQ [Bacillus sp. WP8]